VTGKGSEESSPKHFLKPTAFERLANKTVAHLARLGIGPHYLHLLRVTGRKTGKVYSTPVNLLEINGRCYLVGGRGHAAWSKNAGAVGEVTLIRGTSSRKYRVVPIPDHEKPEILKAYLEEYRYTVQKFFSVPAGSPIEAFRPIANRHPAFEVFPME
jgi:deazaflavin-dependent oxidoreductase (nitroreductase family)